ncbi:MAG: deoxyribodipyrimidine photo-lyase [Chitinophagales bacterium]|jgi:deoxyribodipyrimidine photo-lyase
MASIFWFRRDLRIHDNHGLFEALKNGSTVIPIFIFDTEILDKLDDKTDARVEFIHDELNKINSVLIASGSCLKVFHSSPLIAFSEIFENHDIDTVYCNHDYEPYAIIRDQTIQSLCEIKEVKFKSLKDQVIFERDEVTKDDGKPYTVFTPFSKKWKAALSHDSFNSFPSEDLIHNFWQSKKEQIISLQELGFKSRQIEFPDRDPKLSIIKKYDQTRNFPAQLGTTRISVHLRFGTISIRELAQKAQKNNETYLNELIWREFYMMILWHFPHVVKDAFRAKYDKIDWRNNEREFEVWCKGETGFPIVDAGMRELNATGFMHNRVRMIVASFLVKDLLIDWRWGEAYFAQKLLDFDLSANNGGWQWAAGSGCDAAPYFRIFNPESQQKKFDPDFKYIKKWVPEYLDDSIYPSPIVDRKLSRERALSAYREVVNK